MMLGTVPELIAVCRRGHVITGTHDEAGVNGGPLDCACGSWGIPRTFTARVSTKRCDARCTSALGPSCSCECGGRNHGGDMRF